MNLTDNLNSKELRLNYNNDGFSRASALRPLIQITFEETTFSKVLLTAAMVLLRSPCVSANKIRRTQAAADCNCCQDKEWRKQIVNQSLGVRKKYLSDELFENTRNANGCFEYGVVLV